jgi:hypothetical protein
MPYRILSKRLTAAIWLLVLTTGLNPFTAWGQTKKDGFKQLFDGKTLKGWEGDPALWRVENGTLVGEILPGKPLKTNSFIIWRGGQPKDFELVLECRISEGGNSGINYRSEQLPDVPFALRGYQADIDGKNQYTGQNYEERGRTTLAYQGQITTINPLEDPSASVKDNVKNNAWTGLKVTGSAGELNSLKSNIKKQDWNQIRLVIRGNRLQHFVNGVLISDVTDNDTANRKMAGLLGVQVHVGPPMKVEYRNIRLKQL